EFFLAIMIGVDPELAEHRQTMRLASWFGEDYPNGDPAGTIERSIWNQNPWVPEEVREQYNRITGGMMLLGPEVANQGMINQQGLGLRAEGQTYYFTAADTLDSEHLQLLVNDVTSWVGNGGNVILSHNPSGDVIMRNDSNTRRFRMDFNNTRPHNNPHMHLDWIDNAGNWTSTRIYPLDVAPR
ncbi:MAG: hypothetical protein GY753_06070, partial [Gammaproteobacteria bacterium]|nr:hypothetical protein [Gammaproteobacteria bacterium]